MEEAERKVLGRGRASGPTQREKDGKCDHGDIWRCENYSVHEEGRGGGGAGGRRADTNQRRPCTQPRSASARNFRKSGLLSVFVGFASHQNGGTGTNQQDHRRTRGI